MLDLDCSFLKKHSTRGNKFSICQILGVSLELSPMFINVFSCRIESQLRPKVTTPEAVVASRVSSRKVNNLLGLRVHEPGWQNSKHCDMLVLPLLTSMLLC